MTLGATPQPADVVAELGLTLPYTFQKSDPRPWSLAGLTTASSLVFPTSFANKSLVAETDNRTAAATSHAAVNFDADVAGRWITVLATHGNTGSDPGRTPTATIGGVAATRIEATTTGTGSGTACGAAMFVAQPTGPNGTVAVSWAGLATSIIVLRTVTFALGSAYDKSVGGALDGGSMPMLVDIPTKGLLIGFVARGAASELSWTNLTEQGADSTDSNSKRRSRGWDYNMSMETNRSVNVSPWTATANNGLNAAIVASFAKA